jgi:hypothetical protein
MRITYRRNKDKDYPCIAETTVMGEYHCGVSKTWDEAKTSLIEKVEGYLVTADIPSPEEVDISGPEIELHPWEQEEAACQ